MFSKIYLENPFCRDKKCRLYNAHFQEEVINAQLTLPEFCETHQKLLEEICNWDDK